MEEGKCRSVKPQLDLKTRSSTRTKKLSKSMKIVDEETRRQVQQDRLDALEGD